MTYRILAAMGERYLGEEGTEGVRKGALRGLEINLAAALENAKRATHVAQTTQIASIQPANPNAPGGGSRVKQLRNYHLQQQKKHILSAMWNAEVIRIRQWLFRQGAKVTPAGKIDWARSVRTVVYDRDIDDQEFSRIEIKDGRLITSDGQPLDTGAMVTHFSGPGYAIYVMSQEGHLHVSSHSVGNRHHSSLLAGRDVAGAGELKVTDGKLTWLSNKSGHYCPDALQLLQTLHHIQKAGVHYEFHICYQSSDSRVEYNSLGDFIRGQKFDNPTVESLEQIVATHEYYNESGYAGTYGEYIQRIGLVYHASEGTGLIGGFRDANQPGRSRLSDSQLDLILATASKARLQQQPAA